MPAFIQEGALLLYDTRLKWHGYTFPPERVEVVKVGNKRVKIDLDGRDTWVTPRHLYPIGGRRRVH